MFYYKHYGSSVVECQLRKLEVMRSKPGLNQDSEVGSSLGFFSPNIPNNEMKVTVLSDWNLK